MRVRQAIAPATAWGLAAALALSLGRLSPEKAPQRAMGDDALAVALGDARQTLARALVHKADSYFHGGVDIEHTCVLKGEAHEEAHEHEGHSCACSGHAHEGHVHEHDKESSTSCASSEKHSEVESRHFDPWAWINVHRAAPEIERHLEGQKAIELMPWLSASLKADPTNVDTWTTAWYVADSIMGDKAYGLQILEDALQSLPNNPEILFYKGQALYQHGKGDLPAARAAFVAVREVLRRTEATRPLTEHERHLDGIVSDYLYNLPDSPPPSADGSGVQAKK